MEEIFSNKLKCSDFSFISLDFHNIQQGYENLIKFKNIVLPENKTLRNCLLECQMVKAESLVVEGATYFFILLFF